LPRASGATGFGSIRPRKKACKWKNRLENPAAGRVP
jgi:hypothetical protein